MLSILGANIFLTNDGNCLKIGDFGSAIKIKAHTTMPGELQGFVGTQGIYRVFFLLSMFVIIFSCSVYGSGGVYENEYGRARQGS